MYVPKGRVLLTAAVDRLAEAQRTAGQANDDGKNAARAELRDEFHSGSMLTTVICPRSGKTYKIRPHNWAGETALIWLKQGECLLTEGLIDVDPPLGMAYGAERGTILVSEHDLQRLIAKQESIPRDPMAVVEARQKDNGGRPPDYEGSHEPLHRPILKEMEATTPKMRRRKKKGDGSYASIDLPLLDEMKELILSRRAASPEEAARMLAEKAFGSGSLESKAERLAKRYRENASGPNSLGSGS